MSEPSLERNEDKLPSHLPQPEALQLIPEVMARKYTVIPIAIDGNSLRVAMAEPSDVFALEALTIQSQMRIEPVVASAKEIQQAIDFNYKAYDEIERQISHIPLPVETIDEVIKPDTLTEAPVAQALRLIIDEAAKARASDIHLEPQENKLRIRYRIDGILHDTLSLPLK